MSQLGDLFLVTTLHDRVGGFFGKLFIFLTDYVTTVGEDILRLAALQELSGFEVGGGADDGGTLTVFVLGIQGTTLAVGSEVGQGGLQVGFTTCDLGVILGAVNALLVCRVDLAVTVLGLLVIEI